MKAKLTVDQAGRVLLPKALREDLRLGPGDVVELDSEGEDIRLRPVRPKALVKKEHGVWVYQGEPAAAISLPEVIDRQREKRIRELLGGR